MRNCDQYSAAFYKRAFAIVFILCSFLVLSFLYVDTELLFNNDEEEYPSAEEFHIEPPRKTSWFPFSIEPKPLECSTRSPIILVIIKSAVGEFEERQAIRETWIPEAKRLDIQVLFSVGYSLDKNVSRKLSTESDEFGDVLQSHFLDSYHKLVLKTYCSLKWIVEKCSSVRFVFFTDSDVIVFPTNLLIMALNIPIESHPLIIGYCWLSGAKPVRKKNSKSYMSRLAWPDKYYPPYCSGTGYFMTGDVPLKLYKAIPDYDHWTWAQKLDHLEDVLFTGYLRELAQVDIKSTDNIQHNPAFPYDICKHKRTVTLHSFRPAKRYLESYRNFTDHMKKCKSNILDRK